MGKPVGDWARELESAEDEGIVEMLRRRTQSGFPCGDEEFISRLSELLGRPLARRPLGRSRKE